MRNTIIVMLVFCGSILSAQITRLPNGDYKQEVSKKATTETKTLNVFIDKEGNKYPIYKGKKGGLYVYRISKKSGKTYRYYLPINKEK